MRLGTEGGDFVCDMPEQLDGHRPGFGSDQVGAEIRLAVAGAHVTHDAMQVAEVVDAKDDVRRSEQEPVGKDPFVERAQAREHDAAHGEAWLSAGSAPRRGDFRWSLDISA